MRIQRTIAAVLLVGCAHEEYRMADGSIGAEYPRVNFECSGYADLIAARLAIASREPDRVEIHNQNCISYDCSGMGEDSRSGGMFTANQQEQMADSIKATTEALGHAANRNHHYDLCMQAQGYSLQEVEEKQ